MPTLHFMHTLSGQPDKEVGCEMFEESESILNERGKLCYCVKENGLYKVYKAPLVSTTDPRASKLRVMKGSNEYAVSQGDYADGSWVTVIDHTSNDNYNSRVYPDPRKRSGGNSAGYNVRITLRGENASAEAGRTVNGYLQSDAVHIQLPNSFWSFKYYEETKYYYCPVSSCYVAASRGAFGQIGEFKVEVLQ